MPFYYYFDPTMILLLPGIIIAAWASMNVNSTFNKYNRVLSRSGLTGADVAERVLRFHGVYGVRIERVSGNLTDHYDPKANVIRLSDSTYSSTSIAAAGVAAHEAGHAVQYATNYAPIKFRMSIVRLCNIGSPMAFVFLILAFFVPADISGLCINIAIALYALATVFQLVTLPVEFNASRRAVETLEATSLYAEDELKGAKAVLRAAALTYVAALISSILSLFRFILIVNRGRRD
ncbi:MAG: zinc metallopeptidase [Eubacteriales bacterium]